MKKILKVLCVVLICVICVGCMSGCNNQNVENSQELISVDPEKVVTNEKIVEVLKNNGFDAYIQIESTDTGVHENIIIDKNDTCYIGRRYNYDKCDMMIVNISKNTNIRKILKSVLPLFDINVLDENLDQLINGTVLGDHSTVFDNKVSCRYWVEDAVIYMFPADIG